MTETTSNPGRGTAGQYLQWHDLAAQFNCTRTCFAAYLAMEGAEVVEGVKPGNLVNLVNRDRACGLNPYRLWKDHGISLLAGTGLHGVAMIDRGDSLLLYIYREDLVARVLEKKGVGIILRRQGYTHPAMLHQTLHQLGLRMRGCNFPHEVGIFLGYPLKDVLAFMGYIRLTFTRQGPWKIYGDPRSSLKLADRFRECRCRMASRLCSTSDPITCLTARKTADNSGQRRAGVRY